MNDEQREYLAHIGASDREEILIKRTGWEAINLPTHAHEKFQIIYTLSGTLHIKIGSNTYLFPSVIWPGFRVVPNTKSPVIVVR